MVQDHCYGGSMMQPPALSWRAGNWRWPRQVSTAAVQHRRAERATLREPDSALSVSLTLLGRVRDDQGQPENRA